MKFSKYLWYIILIFIVLFVFRGVLFSPGIAWKGDYVPINSSFAYYTFFTWGSSEHAGFPNLYFLFHFPFIGLQAIFAISFGLEAASKLYELLTLVLISSCMFAASNKLNEGRNRFSSFLSALIYTLNPWVVSRVLSGHFGLLLGYAVTPIFLVTLINCLDQKRLRGTLKPALFLGIIFMAVYHAAVLAILASLLYVSYCILVLHKKFFHCISRLAVIVGVALLLNSFWIFPFVVIQIGSPAQLIVMKSNVQELSVNAGFFNAVRLLGYWWSPFSHDVYVTNIAIFDVVWLLFSFTIPILTLLSLLIMRHRYNKVLYFFILLLMALILYQGTQFLGDLYIQFLGLPFMAVLRDPDKFGYLVALSYSFILGLSFDKVIVFIESLIRASVKIIAKIEIRKINYLVPFLTIVFISISNWVWLTGDFNGYFRPVVLPSSYENANRWLSAQDGEFRVLWFPVVSYVSFSWYPDTVVEPQRFLISKPVLNPERSILDDLSPYTTYFLRSVQNALQLNFTQRIGAILGLATVKFLALRADVEPHHFSEQLLDSLFKQKDLKLVWHEDSIYIFENLEWLPKIRYADTAVIVVGGMRSLLQASYINMSFKNAFFFPEQLARENFLSLANRSDFLFLPLSKFQDWVLAFTPRNFWIDASEYAVWDNNYHAYWIRDSFLQSVNGDLSYGVTVARTDGKQAMAIPFKIENEGRYSIILRILGNDELFDVTLDEKTLQRFTTPHSFGFRWVTFTADLDEGSHSLKIIPKGETIALDKIVVIPVDVLSEYLSKSLDTLSKKHFIYYLEGEEFFPETPEEYQPLSSSSYGFDLSGGAALRLNGSSNFHNNQLVIPKEDNYFLWIRAVPLTRKNETSFQLQLFKNGMGEYQKINVTLPRADNLKWYNLGPIHLSSGSYEIWIRGYDLALDVIALTNSDKLLSNPRLKENNTNAIGYNEVDPTHYKLRGESMKEGFIVFSESFNKLWKLQGQNISSNPTITNLFSMSFEVSISNYNIDLLYVPQVYGWYGWIVSFLTIFMIVSVYVSSKMRFLAKKRSFGFCQRWSLPYLKDIKGLALDVGCGSCELRSLLPKGVEYVGVDVSSHALRSSRGVMRILCDAQNLPFRSYCFETVFAYEILEHLQHPTRFLDEVKRVMNFNAVLVLSTPNTQSPWTKIFLNSKEHIQHFTPNALDNILTAKGFVTLSVPNGVIFPIIKIKLPDFLPIDLHEWCIRLAWLRARRSVKGALSKLEKP